MEQVFATADKLSEVIHDMQKCLQCTICWNTISEPMITPCGHRFCRTCIQTVLQNGNATCPLCNTTINRRNIYTDEHITVYIDHMNNIIQAIKLDSGIDVLAHLTRPRSTRESCSSDKAKQCESDIEDKIKPSCSYIDTSLPVRQPANRANKSAQKIEKIERNGKKKQTRNEMREGTVTKYMSGYGLSGVEPLPPDKSNDFQGKKSTEEKVHNWLKSLPYNGPLDSPNRITPLQPVDGNLDDTLTVSVSQAANDKMENFDVEAAPPLGSMDQSNVQDCRHTSRSSAHNGNNENDPNRRKEQENSSTTKRERRRVSMVELSTNNQKIRASDGTNVNENKERSEERSSDVQKTSTCNMLPAMKQKWSSVAQFGKEMHTRRKKLKTLNVSIEHAGKVRSPDIFALNKSESAGSKVTEVAAKRRGRRKKQRSVDESMTTESVAKIPSRKESFSAREESLPNVGQERELPSLERGDRSMTPIDPPVCESSVASNQVRFQSLDHSQINANLRNEKIPYDLGEDLLERRAEFERAKNLANVAKSMPPIDQPVCESSVASNQGQQIRFPSPDHSQVNANVRNKKISNDLREDLLERCPEFERAENLANVAKSMPPIDQPVCESFVASNQGQQIRFPSPDHSQVNANVRNKKIANDLREDLLERCPEFERAENLANVTKSMPPIDQPVCEVFAASNEGQQIRFLSPNHLQINADLRNEKIANDLGKNLLERHAKFESLANVSQERELPPPERGGISMPQIDQPVCEISIASNEGEQIRIPSPNNSQANADLGNGAIANDLGKNLLKRYVELFETSLENRSKTPTPTKSNGFHHGNLVNESSGNRGISSSTPARTIEKTDEPCSASRFQASPLNRSRLSLKRHAADPKADDPPCMNSRLQAVRRDLNHQIDRSSVENADARKGSAAGIIGAEEIASSRSGEHDERGSFAAAVSRKQENGSMVAFKKLGKVCKLGRKRVRFLYLGTTRRTTLPAHGHAGRSLQKLHNPVDTLEQTHASEDGFGNDVFITVNDTQTFKEKDPNPAMIETSKQPSALSRAHSKDEEQTKQKNLRSTVDSARFESADIFVASLDEVQPTQLLFERSTRSPEKAAAKLLSPTQDSQLRFLSVDSPTASRGEKPVHRSELVKDDDRPKRRSSFSEIRGAHSRALIRTSQQASANSNSSICPEKTSVSREKLSGDSDRSLPSQTTCIRISDKDTPLENRKSCRSSSHSTKDVEALSLNSDSDVINSGKRTLHRRPLLLGSSDDSPEIVCVNAVNEQPHVSPNTKRKRAVSPDSDSEVDLIEVASNWYADAKLGERCKKKGKVDGSDRASNSGDRQSSSRAKLLGVSTSERSSFTGNCWRRVAEKSRLFDEDSPDFAATIDKIKDIRNQVVGEPDKRAEAVGDECLLQDNFDDVMANVDTEALVDEYCNEGRSKRNVRCLEDSDRDDDSEQRGKRVVGDVLHAQRSSKRRKSIVLIDSDDENQRTLVPEYTTAPSKSFRKDESKDDRLATNKSIVNDKDSYDQDSLMNITQHYLMIKQFEEDLFENCKNSNASTKKQLEKAKQQTPRKTKSDAKRSEVNGKDVEHSGEEDDIVENTPDTKTRSITHNSPRGSTVLSPISKIAEEQSSTIRRRFYASDMKTPVCKRSILPLYQSTPKAQQSASKKNHRSDTKIISNLNKSTSSRQTNVTPKSNVAESVSNVGKQKLCFVCSGLVSSQIENVKRLAQIVNARYLPQFDRDVTHVIVKTNKENNGANKTLKYLQGVAYGKWIVSYQWVMDTLKERRLISEKPYEAVDGRTLEAGPRKSRLRENHLFEGFAFLCIGPYDDVTVQQYQDLLRATGGIVVDSLDALAAEKKRWRIIVIQADIYDYEIIKWYKQTQAIPIVHDWIVECISRYKLISFYPYLQELSRQNVLNLGYPEFLIEEEPDEDFDNTTDTSKVTS